MRRAFESLINEICKRERKIFPTTQCGLQKNLPCSYRISETTILKGICTFTPTKSNKEN